jgi:anti-anti-sigma factor
VRCPHRCCGQDDCGMDAGALPARVELTNPYLVRRRWESTPVVKSSRKFRAHSATFADTPDRRSVVGPTGASCVACPMYDRPDFAVHVRGLRSCCPVVVVCGEVKMATAAEFGEALASVLAYDPLHLVVDLANTTFFDCSGIRLLVSAKNHMSEGSKVIVRKPPPTFQEALRILEVNPRGVVIIDAPTRPAMASEDEFAVRRWAERRRLRTPPVPGPLSKPAPWPPGPAPYPSAPTVSAAPGQF